MSSRAIFLLLPLAAISIISTNPLSAQSYDPIPPPEFYNQPLLNGMEILFLPASDGRISFVLMIKNGAAFDPVEKWGVSYLTTWMILEQSKNRNELEIQQGLKELEAELNFQVRWDAIFFFGTALEDRIVDVLKLVAEMVVNPTFTQEAFQRFRDQLVEEVEKERRQIQIRTQELFLAELFQVNPYGHPVKGIPETLRNLTLADVKIQYRKLFIPNQAQLALYYSGDRDRAFTALSRHWGGWIRSDPLPFTFRQAAPPSGRQIRLIDGPSSDSMFRFGKLGVSRDSAEYYVLKVFEQYLTLCLPAWAAQITSKEQIQASSKVETRRMPGYLQLNIQAPPEELIAYFHRFEDWVKGLQRGHVDTEKLEEAKRLVYLELTDALQDPLSRLYRLLETNLYNVGINFITHYGYRLSRVTPEGFQNALREYLSLENFVLVVTGPADQLKPELDKIERVEAPAER